MPAAISDCFMLELGGGTWQIRNYLWVGAWLNSAGKVMPAKSAGCGWYRIGGPYSFPADRAEAEGLLKILSAFKEYRAVDWDTRQCPCKGTAFSQYSEWLPMPLLVQLWWSPFLWFLHFCLWLNFVTRPFRTRRWLKRFLMFTSFKEDDLIRVYFFTGLKPLSRGLCGTLGQ